MRESNSSRWSVKDSNKSTARNFHQIIQQQKKSSKVNKYQEHQKTQLAKQQEQIKSITKQAPQMASYTKVEVLSKDSKVIKLGK